MNKSVCRQCRWSFYHDDFEQCVRMGYEHLQSSRHRCNSVFLFSDTGSIYEIGRNLSNNFELWVHQTVVGVRETVVEFAHAMEEKLRRNDHKQHWNELEPMTLLDGLRGELDELVAEMEKLSGADRTDYELRSRIADEAVDVANYAMMIWDRIRYPI